MLVKVIYFAAWILVGSIEPSKTEWLSQGLTIATQSSTPDGNHPANMALDIEINIASTKAFTAAEPYAWWKLDLTEDCIVTQVLVSGGSDHDNYIGAEIRVGYNNEKFDINPLFAVISNDNFNFGHPVKIDGDVAVMGRYVSIQLQQGGIPLVLGISDIHVHGYRTNKVPDDIYLGCYIDSTPRDLPDHITSSGDMTVDKCVAHCRSSGYIRYAGAQFSQQCFCGNDYNKYGKAAETACNTRCRGNSEQFCGGSWKNSVYSIGLCSGYHTPDFGNHRVQNSDYHFPWPQIPKGHTRISFTVKGGTKGAYLILSPSTEITDTDNIPKIVLGSNNMESAYLCDSSADWLHRTNTTNIMNSQEDRRFFVAFSNDTIEIGREGREPFVVFQPICSLDARYFGIASGFGDTADWTFCGYDTTTSTGCKGPVPVGWTVRNRAGPEFASNQIMVVPGKPFLCDGVVIEWRYWSSRSEAFKAIVWRRIFGKHSEYEIVGINDIPAGASGEEEVYLVPMRERIRVLKGDVIGFAFETSSIVLDENPADGAMVRWNSGVPNGIKQGDTATFSGSGVRGYSLKAIVDSDKSTSVLAPKGMWPLNTEFESKDLTGHKNHGVSTNALYPDETITEDVKGFMKIGGAGGSCIEIPNELDLYVSEFTVLMYIRRRNSAGNKPIMWFDTFDTSSFLTMREGGHMVGFQVVTESGTSQMTSGRFLSYNTWTSLAVTYKAADTVNPGIMSIWVDGHLACSVAEASFDRLRTGSVLKIGSCEGQTGFVGDIAWVQVYDKCLNEAEIMKGQRIPKKGLAFVESLKLTNSGHTVTFEHVAKGCFNNDNSSAILKSRSDVTRMKCAIECVALSDCVAWDWKILHHTKIVRASLITYNVRNCRLLKKIPIANEITKSEGCEIYQLYRLYPV